MRFHGSSKGIRGALVGAALFSCESQTPVTQTYGAAGDAAVAGAAGAAGTGAAAPDATGATGGFFLDASTGATGGTGGFDPDSGCAAETQRGENVQVDMYIMLDDSGSMLDVAPGGGTKWSAVVQALTGFMNDSKSEGLGVGIGFFPATATCATDADCSAAGGGRCFNRVCNSLAVVTPCQSNAQCPLFQTCVPLGECQNDTSYICSNVGQTCLGPGGPCVALNPYSCFLDDICSGGLYDVPAVPIQPLPAVASAIQTAMGAVKPFGPTPTGPALQGAVTYARTWAMANPANRVVTVFVTDGLPTDCQPQTIGPIANIAANALAGTPSISTFVIGVFAPADAAGQSNSNAIATAGGTSQAFIVDPTQGDVVKSFLDALDAIRGDALACEFQIPLPSDGGTLDFDQVNVTFSDTSGNHVSLFYVEDESNCDPTNGGWYYDQNPASGGTPTSIKVCPTTCGSFEVTTGGQVDIVLGCETVIKPPS